MWQNRKKKTILNPKHLASLENSLCLKPSHIPPELRLTVSQRNSHPGPFLCCLKSCPQLTLLFLFFPVFRGVMPELTNAQVTRCWCKGLYECQSSISEIYRSSAKKLLVTRGQGLHILFIIFHNIHFDHFQPVQRMQRVIHTINTHTVFSKIKSSLTFAAFAGLSHMPLTFLYLSFSPSLLMFFESMLHISKYFTLKILHASTKNKNIHLHNNNTTITSKKTDINLTVSSDIQSIFKFAQ